MIIKDEMTGFWCHTLQHNIKEKLRFKTKGYPLIFLKELVNND